ncbi:hypothetical protein ElyMa_003979000 [Elysia marginata]|uniref:Uncharacterized protein n=1 Tax=Elysia marginata TaxID=1093978 RepID=A0AAV4FWZ9_9GAST|nr:hypothetical protein ElyMa_003979000 [Elysia marginata]
MATPGNGDHCDFRLIWTGCETNELVEDFRRETCVSPSIDGDLRTWWSRGRSLISRLRPAIEIHVVVRVVLVYDVRLTERQSVSHDARLNQVSQIVG